MNIDLSNLESIQNLFKQLGYQNNPYFNYDKAVIGLSSYEEIKKMHLLSETDDFKIWGFEIIDLNTSIMNKIANKLYRLNPFEYNLLVFFTGDFKNVTFLHYHREEKGKIKIRRLNVETDNITPTDKEILLEISIKGKSIIDDLDIADIHKKAFDIEKVTQNFFTEFKGQVESISKNIKGLSKKEDKKNYAVLLLSRMIFLYFIQKKKWLNGKTDYLFDRFLYCETNNLNYFEEILKPLFIDCLNTPMESILDYGRNEKAIKLYRNFESMTDKECDPRYVGIPYLNGGLFRPHPKYEINKKLIIENTVFDKLFSKLLNKYNFTVREDLGYDTDIAVDPELLGRIFENMINSEERGLTGSFYTPRSIINFLCKESIKEYLFGKCVITSHEKIEYLVDYLEEENLYSQDRVIIINEETREKKNIDGSKYRITKLEAAELLGFLEKGKICDPAVGSGAFILGMLQLLLLLKRKINFYGYKKVIDLYEEKKEIIKKNLFGVDIQEGAVEIAHLRLWLSLAVEYDAKSIQDIKPLPNLNYKIMQGNSLISKFTDVDFDEELKMFSSIEEVHQESLFKRPWHHEVISKLILLKEKYFEPTFEKDDIDDKILNLEFNLAKELLKTKNLYTDDKQVEELVQNKEVYFSWFMNFPEIFIATDDKDRGFDVIIGNPPYVNTKDVNKLSYKNDLDSSFGFRDDLYNHFTFRGFNLLKQNGCLGYITSNTFLTIQSKLNMRELLQGKTLKLLLDTPPAFKALVDTSIFVALNKERKSVYEFDYIDASKSSLDDFYNLRNSPNVNIYPTNIKVYRDNLQKVFFCPNTINLQIHEKYIQLVKNLYKKWWDKIKTSVDIRNNYDSIEKYRKSLKPGDVTLLGLLTEGGQGMATANNGKFVGIIDGTRAANRTRETRIDKFYTNIITDDENKTKIVKVKPVINNITTKEQTREYLNSLDEVAMRELFDECKEILGRDVFGRGFIYRIISTDEIADVDNLTNEEITKGVSHPIRFFVPYDKGDKEGNRWYLKTPYYIDWSKESVSFLLENSGKGGQGMPVVRNKEYYFREGFCWNDTLNPRSKYIKSRLKEKGVFDVKSMSLFSITEKISDEYLVFIINSYLMFHIKHEFLNNTVSIQVNDLRKLPIIIPTKKQLEEINQLVKRTVLIKKEQFGEEIMGEDTVERLDDIQEITDKLVNELYGISFEEE